MKAKVTQTTKKKPNKLNDADISKPAKKQAARKGAAKKTAVKKQDADISKPAKKQAARKSAAKKTAVKKQDERGASGTRKGTAGKKSTEKEVVYISQLYHSPDKGFYIEYEPIYMDPEVVKMYRKSGLITSRE